MGRKNHRRGHPQAYRQQGGLPPLKRNPKLRVPIEEIVVPKGRCYFRSRYGKLRFTEAEIEKALRQAQQSRAAKGEVGGEERYYPCPDGGCGDYHLTSRKTYTPRTEESS